MGVKPIARFLVSALASLLPQRYRWRWIAELATPDGAVSSGTLQSLACLGLVVYRYVLFSHDRLFSGGTNVLLSAAERGGDTAVMGSGLFLLAEYVIQPITLLLAYFAIEGAVRLAAALVTGETVPTLPLQLLAWAHGDLARRKREHDLGPLMADLVQPGSGDFALTVASCRPKPWTPMSTIACGDQFYELVRETTAEPPRRWVYVLRKRPESKVVRGAVYQYSPDELLQKQESATAAK